MDNFRYVRLPGGADPHGGADAALSGLDALAERDFYVAGAEADVAWTRDYLALAGLPAARLAAWTPA
jgi:hypothetical protein